jgi:IS5 family transposase
MLRQKDVDATWTKKNSENFFGYKNHINADQAHKLIQSFDVSTASVHDSQVFDVLLDQSTDDAGNKRLVYADSAYRFVACEALLEEAKISSKIHERPYKGKPLTDEQLASNKERSRVRVRVEHVFGAQALMGFAKFWSRQEVLFFRSDLTCFQSICSATIPPLHQNQLS